MVVANEWGVNTFQRGQCRTTIDMTLLTRRMGDRVEKCRILEKESLSFHQYTVFSIRSGGSGRASKSERRYLQ